MGLFFRAPKIVSLIFLYLIFNLFIPSFN